MLLSFNHFSRAVLLFFFNDTAPTEIYTLSLHDALPIFQGFPRPRGGQLSGRDQSPEDLRHLDVEEMRRMKRFGTREHRSEEHTSELQSHHDLVCRLLLEKKKKKSAK